jgi:hypothetical protein
MTSREEPPESERAPAARADMHRVEAALWVVIPLAAALVLAVLFWPR